MHVHADKDLPLLLHCIVNILFLHFAAWNDLEENLWEWVVHHICHYKHWPCSWLHFENI